MTKKLDINEIVRLYFDEMLSLVEIGKRFGVSFVTIRSRLLANGYQTREPGWNSVPAFSETERAELVRLHVDEQKNCTELSLIYGVSSVTVQKYLREAGVLRSVRQAQVLRRVKERGEQGEQATETHEREEVAPTESASPENIRRLRETENLRIDEIAERTGLSNLEVYEVIFSIATKKNGNGLV